MKTAFFVAVVTLAVVMLAIPVQAQTAQPQIRIFVAGDSTVSNYPQEAPQRGWGQMLSRFFNSNVSIINLAVSGASTKTFRARGYWDKLLAQLKPGDYVMCQFGHNDSHGKSKQEATDADTDYQANLKKFIAEVNNKGACVILITSMHRGVFGKDGKLIKQNLQMYVEAMKKVAQENNVALIDLYASSGEYMEKVGIDGIAPIFCGVKDDRTHFSESGARAMAELIARDISASKSPLAKYLKQTSDRQ
ncbi:MAG: rhamnogalacturonan acetylesterase [Lentisphaerota bacterium]